MMTGKTLKRIRKQLGLTQGALAEKIGVTRNSVTRWEGDEMKMREPIARLIERLAQEGEKR